MMTMKPKLKKTTNPPNKSQTKKIVNCFFPCCSCQKQHFQHVAKECNALNTHPQIYSILTNAHSIILTRNIALQTRVTQHNLHEICIHFPPNI
jgi:hypothetical protein